MKRLLLIILVVSVGLCAFGVTRYLCAESVCGVATSGERELMLKVSNFSRLSTALHLYLESNNYFATVQNTTIVVSLFLLGAFRSFLLRKNWKGSLS
ncbi:MAG: hypothetical protein ACYS18_10005 [Planctomycetota bacterium]